MNNNEDYYYTEQYNLRLLELKKISLKIQKLRKLIHTIDDKIVWIINTTEIILKLLYTFNINNELYEKMGKGRQLNFNFNNIKDINKYLKNTDTFFKEFKTTIYSFKEAIPGEEL